MLLYFPGERPTIATFLASLILSLFPLFSYMGEGSGPVQFRRFFFSFGIRILKDTCILVAFSAKKKDYSGRFGLYKGEAGDYPTMPVTRWVPWPIVEIRSPGGRRLKHTLWFSFSNNKVDILISIRVWFLYLCHWGKFLRLEMEKKVLVSIPLEPQQDDGNNGDKASQLGHCNP